ncbi:uncharacterized protein LOC111694919 isoform X3 [Eurytemora carolleeae]|uniref:uncharacterized protein LOC111694919 isoform X3 n=1 Tax=Eurytemora carolleeae TaxID=1294199 RepID=UPI000C755D94|nr:uncharacterized protein LOC111694919 isoform X3 [Eurytemora carolleeae]|eukprot:XP_023319744.1 uncharacterized protein LOC111694919 isoform X3 [Eurytemora affinis]
MIHRSRRIKTLGKFCREFDGISAVYPNCGFSRKTVIANKLENAGNLSSKYPPELISSSQPLDKNESYHMNRLPVSPFSSSSSTSADDYFLQESDESFHENKVSSELFRNRDRLRNDLFSHEKPKSKLQKGKQGSLLNPDRPKLRKKRGFTKNLTETSDTPCQCEILTSQLAELRNKLDNTLLENSKLEELLAKLAEPVSLNKSHLLENSNFSDHFEDINFEDFLDVSFNSSNPSGKQSLERSSPDGEAGNDNKDNHDDSDSTIKELDETLEMKSIGKPEISDEDTNDGLQCRVKELEETLEMIQEEFELMEDYWQEKLKKEREFYIQQLDVTEEQLEQLEARIQHYQLIIRTKQVRTVLEPVLERMDLEAEVEVRETEINQLRIQVEDLTQELTDLKHQV